MRASAEKSSTAIRVRGFHERLSWGSSCSRNRPGRLVRQQPLSQADIMAVVCYQAASQFVLPDHVSAEKFPRLQPLSERAMKIDAFASTVPHL